MSKAGNVLITAMLLGQMCGGEYMKMCMDDLEDELHVDQGENQKEESDNEDCRHEEDHR